jgi:hypothetical protein
VKDGSGDQMIGRSGEQLKDETRKPKVETRDDFRISSLLLNRSSDHPICRSFNKDS